ncbi:MAG: penicillin-binding protein [Flavisolibacter sp.]
MDSLSLCLSNYFNDKSKSAYKKELLLGFNEKDRYYLLKKGLSFDQYKVLRNFPLVKLGRNKSGFITETKSRRLNPFGLLAKRTIGLSRDNAQSVGIERTYDNLLKGTKGKRLVRFISGGAAVPIEGYEIDPENGRDVYTTLNIQIQDIVESSLMKMMIQNDAEHGTCILMETKTGEIKSIANLGRDGQGHYGETLNYALQSTEPGSTIKLATLLAVLEKGSSKIDDLVEIGSTGKAFVGVRIINDAEPVPKPVLTVRECFAHSSNIGFSKIAYKAFSEHPDEYKSYLRKFHLDTKTGIDLVGEELPVLPKLKRNRQSLHALLTASFGYAIEVSPLQTLMLYNAIANNGKMMKPYLVRSIRNNGLIVKEFGPTVLEEQLCKPEVIQAAKTCMEAVTTIGTAKEAFKEFPFLVAGKTGTAHVAGSGISYGDGAYQASFVGYFPADRPEYTCIVVIRTKQHAAVHFGGQLAAPVFKEIAAKLYAQYIMGLTDRRVQIATDSSAYRYRGAIKDLKYIMNNLGVHFLDSSANKDLGIIYKDRYTPTIKSENFERKTVPDLRHLTLKDALYQLEKMNMRVVVRGKGKIIGQDVPPGTIAARNQIITILLNP